MIDLQSFCAVVDDHRDYLHQPFVHRGFVYATTGAVLVRIPAPGTANVQFPHRPGDVVDAMFSNAVNDGFQPLPELAALTQCKHCAGKRRPLQITCKSCVGTGEQRGIPCEPCEGWGHVLGKNGRPIGCHACQAFGTEFVHVPLRGSQFDGRYLALISTLPGLLVAVGAPELAMHFTFEGGEGLLMPVRPEAMETVH